MPVRASALVRARKRGLFDPTTSPDWPDSQTYSEVSINRGLSADKEPRDKARAVDFEQTRLWLGGSPCKLGKESNQSFGLTRDLHLPDNLSLRVHNAHARRIPMTRRFRHSAPWLFSVSRCLGPTQSRDPVSSFIGGQPHQLPVQRRAHYGI